MSHAPHAPASLEAAKAMAGRLFTFLKAADPKVKRTHAYEGLAQAFGFPNWNILRAHLTQPAAPTGPRRLTAPAPGLLFTGLPNFALRGETVTCPPDLNPVDLDRLWPEGVTIVHGAVGAGKSTLAHAAALIAHQQGHGTSAVVHKFRAPDLITMATGGQTLMLDQAQGLPMDAPLHSLWVAGIVSNQRGYVFRNLLRVLDKTDGPLNLILDDSVFTQLDGLDWQELEAAVRRTGGRRLMIVAQSNTQITKVVDGVSHLAQFCFFPNPHGAQDPAALRPYDAFPHMPPPANATTLAGVLKDFCGPGKGPERSALLLQPGAPIVQLDLSNLGPKNPMMRALLDTSTRQLDRATSWRKQFPNDWADKLVAEAKKGPDLMSTLRDRKRFPQIG